MEVAALVRLLSDQRLAEQVCAGSDRAFEVLYDRHHRGVLGFCRHMLGSREEGEDALQHTFMAAYRDLRRSGPPAAVRPWLFVIARNRCISVLRARREHPAADVPELATDELATEVAAREELRAVLAAVARLPDEQRAALVLAELGDVSHDEIARILDCRREQVKAYVYQARVALITDRVAREMPCADIRAQLAEMRGGQLRRAPLRRHLHDCDGCREFRDALRGQRRALGLVLPVAPGLGLKRAVFGAALGGGGGGLSLGGLAATAVLVVAIPAGTAAVATGSDAPGREAPVARTSASAAPVGSATRRERGAEARRLERTPRAGANEKPAARRRTPAATQEQAKTGPRDEPSAIEQPEAAATPTADTEQGRPASKVSEPTSPLVEAKTSPGQDGPQSAPSRGRLESAPERGRSESAPARGRSQSAPGQAKAGSAPGQNMPSPAAPAGQENKPVTPAESKPEHAAEPGPPPSLPSLPGQAGSPGPPEEHPNGGPPVQEHRRG